MSNHQLIEEFITKNEDYIDEVMKDGCSVCGDEATGCGLILQKQGPIFIIVLCSLHAQEYNANPERFEEAAQHLVEKGICVGRDYDSGMVTIERLPKKE